MSKKLENVFNECVERMLRGESLRSCLESYPEEAVELESMLKTAFDIARKASPVQPHPEFKDLVQTRLEGAHLYARQRKQLKKTWIFVWKQGWVYALTIVLIILFAGVGTVAASSNALPDEPLYQVKLAAEQIRLVFTFTDAGRAKLYTQIAENRVQEIAAMAREGKTEQVNIVTQKLDNNLTEANHAIKRVRETEARESAATSSDRETERLKEFVEGSASESIAILENALENTPEQTQGALQQAIDVSRDHYGTMQLESDTETDTESMPVQPEQSDPSLRK
jgi:hypothetical protein